MGRKLLVTLVLSLCAEAVLAQAANTSSASTSTINTAAPVAYVYVSSKHYIHAYKAWADGKITSVTGSPFPYAGVASVSVTKNFLFGADTSQNLFSYSIHSNGSISKVSSLHTPMYQASGCEQSGFGTQVDYSQATLYYYACTYGFNTNTYLSFHINSTGSLQFLGGSGGAISAATQGTPEILTKMGGNSFAFDSYCAEDDFDTPVIQIFRRQSNGNLVFYGEENHMPEPAPGTAYCAGMVAADASNHLAAAVQRIDSQPHDAGYIYGPYFIASYTSDANGNLSTTSTYQNMPAPVVAQNRDIRAMSISPDGKYVAVGADGFEVMHFNGANPVTNFSGAFLAGHDIVKFGWDNVHHLYVLSAVNSGGTYTTYLHIFNVTSTGVKEVSGSPHYIANLTNLTVLDLQ